MSHWIRFKYIELPLRMQIGAPVCVFYVCINLFLCGERLLPCVFALRVRAARDSKKIAFHLAARVFMHTLGGYIAQSYWGKIPISGSSLSLFLTSAWR